MTKTIHRPLFLCVLFDGSKVVTYFVEDKYIEDDFGFVTCEYPVECLEEAVPMIPIAANAPGDQTVAIKHGIKFMPFSFIEPPRKMPLRVIGYYRVENARFYKVHKDHCAMVESARGGISIATGPLPTSH